MEQLEATILGTVFRNPENGWSVVTVRSGRSELTVVGSLPEYRNCGSCVGGQILYH